MSEIKAGDLVMINKRNLCGCGNSLGYVFLVSEINADSRGGDCIYCKRKTFPPYTKTAYGIYGHVELSRLIKIDPPSTVDSMPTRKDMKEPS